MNQLSTPLFKRDDQVELNRHTTGHLFTITDGPFEPGLKRTAGETRRAFTYVITPVEPSCSKVPFVVSESSLTRIPPKPKYYIHTHDKHSAHTHEGEARHA